MVQLVLRQGLWGGKKVPLLTTFSTRLGRTTLAKGMLTGSLLGCTVLRGILMGRLVMVSPLFADVLSRKACKHTKQTMPKMQLASSARASGPWLSARVLGARRCPEELQAFPHPSNEQKNKKQKTKPITTFLQMQTRSIASASQHRHTHTYHTNSSCFT